MLCTECGKQRAVLHVARIVNGQKTEAHLCERCASAQEQWGGFSEPKFSVHDLLAGLLPVPGRVEHRPAVDEPVCPGCGLTYREFTETGLLGCPECYTAFVDVLEPVLRRVHGGIQHEGKAPVRLQAKQKAWRELKRLRSELERSIKEERYEDAVDLRDQIRSLERRNGKE